MAGPAFYIFAPTFFDLTLPASTQRLTVNGDTLNLDLYDEITIVNEATGPAQKNIAY